MSAGTEVPEGLSFTMDAYTDLLQRLVEAGYRFAGYDDAADDERVVLLRHDVDLSPQRALEMADAEATMGISSTYFFLVTTPVYDLLHPETRRAVETVAALGHDVGLHFDAHHYWNDRPGESALTERITAEQESLRCVVDAVDAVSFHVPPEWVLGETYDGFTNTYEPAYFEAMTYLSDSNQRWRAERPFGVDFPDRVQVLVHPGLWHDDDRELNDILADLDRQAHQAVTRYMALLGE